MGDQASFYHSSAFYLLHVGFLLCLFLMAFFRTNLKPLFSISMASKGWLKARAQKSCAVFAFLLAILIQWEVYENLDWLELRYWPPIAFAAAFLWKQRSFWLIFLFYLLHYNFAFDGPMTGPSCTVIKSPDANLVFVQERWIDKLFGDYPTGFDQIFGGYRGWGLIDWEGEACSFGLDGKYMSYYRPKVSSRVSGEVVICFGANHKVMIYPDGTYEEHRGGKWRRDVLQRWNGEVNFGRDQETFLSAISNFYRSRKIEGKNYFRLFILYFLYPVFFINYWCLQRFRVSFSDSGWFYFAQWFLIFLSYLSFGIPEPVYWPLMLMFLGWLRNQEREAFCYFFCLLIFLWALALFVCNASRGPVSWIWGYLIWTACVLISFGFRFGPPQVAEMGKGVGQVGEIRD